MKAREAKLATALEEAQRLRKCGRGLLRLKQCCSFCIVTGGKSLAHRTSACACAPAVTSPRPASRLLEAAKAATAARATVSQEELARVMAENRQLTAQARGSHAAVPFLLLALSLLS